MVIGRGWVMNPTNCSQLYSNLMLALGLYAFLIAVILYMIVPFGMVDLWSLGASIWLGAPIFYVVILQIIFDEKE